MAKQAKDMEKDYVRKDLKLSFLKFLLLCSLMSLWIQDVSPTGTLDCEISAQKCQTLFQTITVPSKHSKVTFNCSIKNGGKVQHITWKYLEKHLNASDAGLFLQRNRSQLRECFSIKYAIPVQRMNKTSSPVVYHPDTREMELKCTFKGWPRPRVVWYNPNNKEIINGSEGFYISEQLVGKDTLTSLLRNANIQEKQAGAYKCTGMNNITGWSSEKSGIIDLKHSCLWPKAPQIYSSAVSVTAYFNVSLKCLVTVKPDKCQDLLQWYFNNSSVKLKSGEKYDIQERKTNTTCKKDFILTIVNVTDADKGEYRCQWLCEEKDDSPFKSSVIHLKVDTPSVEDPSTPSSHSTSAVPTSGQGNSKSADKWIPAIAILTSGVGLVFNRVYGVSLYQ